VTVKVAYCQRREAKNGGRYFRIGADPVGGGRRQWFNNGEEIPLGSYIEYEPPQEKKAARPPGSKDEERITRSVALKCAAMMAPEGDSDGAMRMAEEFLEWLNGL
jgi:hypothetical protein